MSGDETPTRQPRERPVLRLPQRVGPCLLLERIGHGGMGSVYRAEMAELRSYAPAGTFVAVKLLDAEQDQGRFAREAAIGSSIHHPALVRTWEHGHSLQEGQSRPYLILEYVAGRTLRELLAESSTLPEPLLRHLGAQVAHALTALHAAGVVHRDLKPGNIVITPEHVVKLLDLGVAWSAAAGQALTTPGAFIGTARYAAPEQFWAGRIDGGTDLYALGVVLYEAATGSQPFAADSLPAVMQRHLEHVPARADEVKEGVSPFFGEVLACLLEKEPGRRFRSANALACALEEGEASSWWRERERPRTGRAARPQVERTTGLVGREGELEALLERFRCAARGAGGGVVLIEGEAGAGKSRLLDELVRQVESETPGAHVLYGSHPPGAASGLGGALADALARHFDGSRIHAPLHRLLAESPALVPVLAALIARTPLPAGNAALALEPVHEGLCRLAESLAAEKPLLWMVEDLHFAGAEARELVLGLARQASRMRMLLVLTVRPGLPGELVAELGRLSGSSRIGLDRLSPREVMQLLRLALGSEALADRLAGPVALRSDGNPLFVLEVVRELAERERIIRRADGSYTSAGILDTPQVPSTIVSLLAARLGELARGERELLDVGAVQGFAFDADLVGRVLGRRRLEVLQTLADLERRSGVVRASGAGFCFDHHLLQEVIYARLPAALAAEYHALLAAAEENRRNLPGRAAEAVPGDVALFLARHFLRGHEWRRGLARIEHALDHLAATHQVEALVHIAGLALAAPDLDLRLRVEIRLRQIEALKALGDRQALGAAVEDAAAAAGSSADPVLVARAGLARGRMHSDFAEYGPAVVALEAARERARDAGSAATAAAAVEVLATVNLNRGEAEAARERYREALVLAVAVGDRALEARASVGLAGALDVLGEPAEATVLHHRAIGLAHELGDLRAERRARINLGSLLRDLGEFEEARRALESALALAREAGARLDENSVLINLAYVDMATGRLGSACTGFARALETARLHGYRRQEIFALVNLGAVDLLEGRLERAGTVLGEAHALALPLGGFVELLARYFLGGWQRARGDLGAAATLLEQALAAARALRQSKAVAEVTLALGRCRLELGQRPEACELLLEAEALSGRLQLADTGQLPAALLAGIGERDPAVVSATLTAKAPVAVRAEIHLALARAGAEGPHREQARALLEELSAHLSAADREAFWRSSPAARGL